MLRCSSPNPESTAIVEHTILVLPFQNDAGFDYPDGIDWVSLLHLILSANFRPPEAPGTSLGLVHNIVEYLVPFV